MSKAKKRKTRKDKILADLHRKIKVVEQSNPVSISAPINSTPKSEIKEIKEIRVVKETKTNKNLNKYPYLIGDIRKTSIVTGSIIGAQIIFFLILKFQVIKLPGIVY